MFYLFYLSGVFCCSFCLFVGIVKSDYIVDVLEIFFSDFVFNKFKEYGDDIVVVSNFDVFFFFFVG